MSGCRSDLSCNILNESTLYVVFIMIRRHIEKEIQICLETGEECDLWRMTTLEAFEQVLVICDLCHLSFVCVCVCVFVCICVALCVWMCNLCV